MNPTGDNALNNLGDLLINKQLSEKKKYSIMVMYVVGLYVQLLLMFSTKCAFKF